MKIFDSHCHLDDKSFANDLDSVIERARSAGVLRMMTIGVNWKTSRQAVALAQSHRGIFASVGIHPHDANHASHSVLQGLIDLAKNDRVCAWGEMGLDFNRMYSPREDQEMWLEKQLEAAAALDLAMIFHERDSNGRFLEILQGQKPSRINGVVHCFSGNRRELEQYLALGLYIGVTGILTIKNRGAGLRRLVTGIPADRLVVETDAPYLVPAPHKNRIRRNEPAFVKAVLLKLAEARRQDPRQLAEIIWQNTCRLYGLESEDSL